MQTEKKEAAKRLLDFGVKNNLIKIPEFTTEEETITMLAEKNIGMSDMQFIVASLGADSAKGLDAIIYIRNKTPQITKRIFDLWEQLKK